MWEEEQESFLLQYEKQKIQECAGTLHNLASAFLIEEKEEDKGSDRKNFFLKKRLQESRILVADQLKEMANLMEKAAGEKIRIIYPGEKNEKQMAKALLSEGLLLEDFYILEKESGRKEVIIRVYQGKMFSKNKVYSVEEVATFLSVFLNLRLVPSLKTPFFITDKPQNFCFEENTKYMVLTGYAKSVKEGEKISGDNYTFFESREKKFLGVLSDGMGSGEKACKDSEMVLDMAERYLDGGFSLELTAKMINDGILVGGEEKNMSTLDICSIDLYTGQAEFLKVGAAYGFLKRDGYVEKIPSISLPLGLFYELEMNQCKKQLLDGDYVFLFSDGILENFSGEKGEEFLKEMVAQIPYKRPSEMAAHVMKHAIAVSKGRIKDDMTVLVMGIWENTE